MSDSTTVPWRRKKPAGSRRTKLTAANVRWARARAKKAGRRYPNLVDNMAAARRQADAQWPKSADRVR